MGHGKTQHNPVELHQYSIKHAQKAHEIAMATAEIRREIAGQRRVDLPEVARTAVKLES